MKVLNNKFKNKISKVIKIWNKQKIIIKNNKINKQKN